MINLVFVVLISSWLLSCSQDDSLKKSTLVEVHTHYSFKVKETRRIDFHLVIPPNILGVQKVINQNFSRNSLKMVQEGSDSYAVFRWANPKDSVSLDVNFKVAVNDSLFAHGKCDSTYLREEPFLDVQDSTLQSLSNSVIPKLKTIKDTIDLIDTLYKITRASLEYKGYDASDRGAAVGYKLGGGDCSEYSDLLTTLLRIRGVCARSTYGYITGPANTPKHAWTEVFLKGSWKRLDPTFGPDSSGSIWGSNQKKVELSSLRNDEFLDLHHYASYRYWGDPVVFREKTQVKVVQ